MFRAFTDIAQLLGQMLPPWALATVLVVLALTALPFWIRSVKTKKVSGRTRRLVRAEGAERAALVEEIFSIAGTSPAVLTTVTQQAIRYDQRDVRDRALAALEATGRAPADVAHFKAKLTPERKPVPHPLEVAVNVERLLEEGMFDTAMARLDEALARYPGDPDLLALRDRAKSANS